MATVSVVVPSYNCAQYLPEALESVLGQTYQDFEIIVTDDGSTDNTREIVTNYLKRYPDKIKYTYQDNKGLAAARNTAIKCSTGKFIAILDADDLCLPRRLEEEVGILERNGDVGLVHADIEMISQDGQPLGMPTRRSIRFKDTFRAIFLRELDIYCPTVMVRRQCFDELGFFDENLSRLGCEDREMWLRISRKYKVHYLCLPLAAYRVRNDSMSRNLTKMVQARYYVVNKFFPESSKEMRPLRNMALAKIHKELGDVYMFEKRFNEAKVEYVKAFSLYPLYVWPFVNFLKSCLKLHVNTSRFDK